MWKKIELYMTNYPRLFSFYARIKSIVVSADPISFLVFATLDLTLWAYALLFSDGVEFSLTFAAIKELGVWETLPFTIFAITLTTMGWWSILYPNQMIRRSYCFVSILWWGFLATFAFLEPAHHLTGVKFILLSLMCGWAFIRYRDES